MSTKIDIDHVINEIYSIKVELSILNGSEYTNVVLDDYIQKLDSIMEYLNDFN